MDGRNHPTPNDRFALARLAGLETTSVRLRIWCMGAVSAPMESLMPTYAYPFVGIFIL